MTFNIEIVWKQKNKGITNLELFSKKEDFERASKLLTVAKKILKIIIDELSIKE